MRTVITLTIINILFFSFLGALFLEAEASANELPNNNGPAFGVQVFHCDANGDNCVAADPVVKVSKQVKKSVNPKTADEVIAAVIEKAEAEQAMKRLIADANSDRDTTPLDTPQPTALANR